MLFMVIETFQNQDARSVYRRPKDPIQFSGSDPTLYGYVENDPVNLVDPAGLSPSFSECLARCAAEHYGLGTLVTRGAVGAGAVPLYKPAMGLPVVRGASKFTPGAPPPDRVSLKRYSTSIAWVT